jgi:hypothetical protein
MIYILSKNTEIAVPRILKLRNKTGEKTKIKTRTIRTPEKRRNEISFIVKVMSKVLSPP